VLFITVSCGADTCASEVEPLGESEVKPLADSDVEPLGDSDVEPLGDSEPPPPAQPAKSALRGNKKSPTAKREASDMCGRLRDS
jgi:hypothetical protein